MNYAYYRIREFYLDHPSLQQAYSGVTGWRARAAARRGADLEALTRHCDAGRRLVTDSPGNRRRRRAAVAALARFVRHVHGGGLPASPADNRLAQAFRQSPAAQAMRARLATWPRAKQCRLGGNLLLLKTPGERERGVVMVTYTNYFDWLHVAFQPQPLFERYTVVLEPSWTPYPSPYWGLFASSGSSIVVQTLHQEIEAAMADANLGLQGVAIGSHQWADPEVFRPLGLEKDFDLVMVASFARTKRHSVLFRALRQLRPRRLRVALIGTAWERTQEEFEAEMRAYGVREDCTLFRGISAEKVNEVLNRSRAALLLTRVEGGNRSMMEALAAGTPVILYQGMVGPRAQVNAETGRWAEDHELARVIEEVLADPGRFQPRAWFERNSGYVRSTERLNAYLRQQAEARGERWTRDIAAKTNRPDVVYAHAEEERKLEPGYADLEGILCPLGANAGLGGGK